MEMQSAARPFFSARLLVTAADGTYGGIRKSETVAAYGDRIVIGSTVIDYRYLVDVRVYGNVLHVSYAASDGKQVERFFKYNTFLAKTGANALRLMADRVEAARRGHIAPSVWKPQAAPVQQPVKAELLERVASGWHRIAVYSALVAFPASCPVCVRPADAIATFRVSAGFDEKGTWLVPVCREHEVGFQDHLTVSAWRAGKSRLEFLVWNPEYAKLFLMVNAGDQGEQVRRQGEASPLSVSIRHGARLVQFQHTVSALYVALLLPSRIFVLERGQRPFLTSLRYSLSSALLGWWSIPGLIWTPMVIVRNCRGGIDLTSTVAAVLSGAAMSPGGFR